MGTGLSLNRYRECKNSLGGLNKIYLFKHVNYSRSQIVLNDNTLVTYPSTTIYQYEVNNQPSVNQRHSEEAGGKFYDVSIDFELAKENAYPYLDLLNFNINIIVKDRNGKFRFLGNYNGLELSGFNNTTGGGKNSLNGLSLSFEGKEEKEAWFINNLEDAGFNIFTGIAYLLQENGDLILQEDGFKIIL